MTKPEYVKALRSDIERMIDAVATGGLVTVMQFPVSRVIEILHTALAGINRVYEPNGTVTPETVEKPSHWFLFAYVLTSFAVLVLGTMCRAMVFVVAWRTFAEPVGLAPITIWHVAAISTVYRLMVMPDHWEELSTESRVRMLSKHFGIEPALVRKTSSWFMTRTMTQIGREVLVVGLAYGVIRSMEWML